MADTGLTARQETGRGGRKIRRKRIPGAKKIRRKELPAFTRQLAAMLSSGMPVVQTLVALEEQATNPHFKAVVTGSRQLIEGGASFSDAFAHYPDVFDTLYLSMLRAGEIGGMLAETTARIASHLEARERLRRKIAAAMTYPVIVMVIVFVITTGIILFIVPRFADIYSDFGGELPGPTQFLVHLSNIFRRYALLVVGVVVLVSITFSRLKKTETGGYLWALACLKMPVLGDLATKIALARFASTFSQMIRSGVPILHALDIVGEATGNLALKRTVLAGRATVERGEPLSLALARDQRFPRMLIHMLAAGEKTGRVDEMLEKIATFYDDEVETMLASLTSLIEPLLIVFLGVVVGGIVVCLFMPIFKMHEIVAM